MFDLKFPLFSPVGDGEGSSISDDIDLLAEGEETPFEEETPSEEDSEEESEESEEEEEEEEESGEESEESEEEEEKEEKEEEEKEEEETLPYDRPTIKQITEKYPKLFKDFPQLKDVYFRERQFTQLFTTIEDAKSAVKDNEAFVNLRNDVLNSTGEKVFVAIKEAGNIEKFANTILGTLLKVEPKAFWRAANPLVEDILRGAFSKGQKDGGEDGENLQNAARVISKFFFNSEEFAEGKKTSILKEETTDPSVKSEREQFEQEKYTTFDTEVRTESYNSLKRIIIGKVGNTEKLDPEGVLTSWMRESLLDAIVKEIGKQMDADKDHIRFMNNLWEKAKGSKFSSEYKSRLISTYLARAKQLAPKVRARLLAEVLKKSSTKSGSDKRKIQDINDRSKGSSQGKPSKNNGSGKVDWNKTSDLDILNDNITYK